MRILTLIALSVPLFACEIRTSMLEKDMRFAQSNWHSKTIFVIDIQTKRQRSFSEAYNQFQQETRGYIQEIVCTQHQNSGVVNYHVNWQSEEKAYFFTATFDEFSYR